jgi:hypothetical protein
MAAYGAVGRGRMPVARHPPHGSVRALLTHTVLTLDGLREANVCFAYAERPMLPAEPARCPARGSPSAFSLVNGLPSAISFGPPWPAFDRFVGNTPLCDSPWPCIWVL